MPILQTLTTSFKVGLLTAQFDFSINSSGLDLDFIAQRYLESTGIATYKMALYTASANLGADTTAYTTANEVSGPGYFAGGQILSIAVAPTSTGTTAYFSFDNAVWSSASFIARGALIYVADGVTNPSVAVLDFGADRTATIGVPFVVAMPPPTATTALIRLP